MKYLASKLVDGTSIAVATAILSLVFIGFVPQARAGQLPPLEEGAEQFLARHTAERRALVAELKAAPASPATVDTLMQYVLDSTATVSDFDECYTAYVESR